MICDFAETYGILDYRAHTPFQAAILAYGLRPDSRIVLKASGMDTRFPLRLMVRAIDELSMIRWLNSRDGAQGVNRPALLSDIFEDKEPDDEEGYDTPEEFMRDYYGEK